MTARNNSDCVENWFSRTRYIGGSNTDPGPVEFKNRFRLLVLGQSAEFVVESAAVECAADDDEVLESSEMLSHELFQSIENEFEIADLRLEHVNSNELENCENIGVDNETTELVIEVDIPESKSDIDCHEEGYKYVAGYLAFKLKR